MKTLFISMILFFYVPSIWAIPQIENCIDFFLPLSEKDKASWKFSKDLLPPQNLLGKEYLMSFHGSVPQNQKGVLKKFRKLFNLSQTILSMGGVYSLALADFTIENLYLETSLLDNDHIYDNVENIRNLYSILVRKYLEMSTGLKLDDMDSNYEMNILPLEKSKHPLSKISNALQKQQSSSKQKVKMNIPLSVGFYNQEENTILYNPLTGIHGESEIPAHEIFHLQQEQVRKLNSNKDYQIHKGPRGVWPKHRIVLSPSTVFLNEFRNKMKLHIEANRFIESLDELIENFTSSSINLISNALSRNDLNIQEKIKNLLNLKNDIKSEIAPKFEDVISAKQAIEDLRKEHFNRVVIQSEKNLKLYQNQMNGYFIEEIGAYIKNALYHLHLFDDLSRSTILNRKILIFKIEVYLYISRYFLNYALEEYIILLRKIEKQRIEDPNILLDPTNLNASSTQIDLKNFEANKQVDLQTIEQELHIGLKWLNEYDNYLDQLDQAVEKRKNLYLAPQ